MLLEAECMGRVKANPRARRSGDLHSTLRVVYVMYYILMSAYLHKYEWVSGAADGQRKSPRSSQPETSGAQSFKLLLGSASHPSDVATLMMPIRLA